VSGSVSALEAQRSPLATTPPLPARPRPLQRLVELAAGPREPLVAALRQLPIAPTLLFLANSAYRNIPVRFRSLTVATAYLGPAEIGRLALGLMAVHELSRGGSSERRYLRRSCCLGLSAAQLCRQLEPALDPTQLWPTALLLDIGELLRDRWDPRCREELALYRRKHGCSVASAETALGFRSHMELGAELCQSWQLGYESELACLYHEQPRPGPGTIVQRDRRRMLMAADRLLSLSEAPAGSHLRLRHEIVSLLGLAETQVEWLLDTLRHPIGLTLAALPV
jgi:HD-like signal output (HDOD) protein